MMANRILVATALLIALSFGTAEAAVNIPGVNNTMGVVSVNAPSSVVPGATQRNRPILFAEVVGGTIGSDLAIDHNGSNVVAAPTLSGNTVNPHLNPGTLSAGTGYNSYMFHFDSSTTPFYVSYIEFDSPVIGVQLFSNGLSGLQYQGSPYTGSLEAGDALVGGSSGVSYPTSVGGRGVEEDLFVLAIDGSTVMLAGSAFGAEIDQLRILTASESSGTSPTPEPGAFLVWATVIGCCGRFLVARSRG